jgi:Taurine catabolism dioxygenase TauD, TfdA family
VSDLKSIGGLPILLEVATGGLNALNWAEENQLKVQNLIKINGAVLIRGLKIPGSSQFGKILSTLFGSKLLEYIYRSTPRTELRGNVYTATEYHESEVMPQHNENSYSRHWPNRSRVVYSMLPKSVRDKFEQKGVMYVRNYSALDLPWPVVFQTDDKSQVEKYCKENELNYEWIENDGLRTSRINPATAAHPHTGEKIWFNQAHLFHVSSLGKAVAEALIASLGEENLPRNSYYGDGSPIEAETLELIRSTYDQTKIKFAWQKGDLLLLDNMLFTHGREPYTSTRKVLVGMACPNR